MNLRHQVEAMERHRQEAGGAPIAVLWDIWRTAAPSMTEGAAGPWRIVRSVTTAADEAENRRQAQLFGESRYTEAGTHTALVREGDVWMADNYDEMADHLEVFEQARERGGRCLVNGLGLGLITRALLTLESVTHVDVVELDRDVITLVAPAFRDQPDRLTIHQGDCFTKVWPADVRWSVVWHDIWQPMVQANLPEMDRLHRMFEDRCDWQDSWGRDWLLRPDVKQPLATASYGGNP